jgi:hypothetical protein
MCTELLPPGGYPIAVKYIIYLIISYHKQKTLYCTNQDTHTHTLTEQLYQCCWPTSTLDCTNKSLHNFHVITKLQTEQDTILHS